MRRLDYQTWPGRATQRKRPADWYIGRAEPRFLSRTPHRAARASGSAKGTEPPKTRLMPPEQVGENQTVLPAPKHLPEAIIEIPKRDEDGNPIGSVRLPDIRAARRQRPAKFAAVVSMHACRCLRRVSANTSGC